MTEQTAREDARPLDSTGYYEYGATSLFACRHDQRFSYCLYVPSCYGKDPEKLHPLAVVVHGTDRTAQRYRDEFAGFAEESGCVILAPLFPGGIIEPRELHDYKFIKFRGLRFDQILLGIVDEVRERYRVSGDRFLLHGFSGGGQFAHRFFYVHPDRLLGVSIGAPGHITLLDSSRDWWVGTNDFERHFGAALRVESLRRVPVHMVIGGEDTETWEINDKNGRLWMEGADAAGRTRLERLAALKANYENLGIPVRHDVVPGIAHDGFDVLEPVKDFFRHALTQRHQNPTPPHGQGPP